MSASAPIVKVAKVNGIALRKPPILSRSWLPAIAAITEPAHMNSALKKACVIRWNTGLTMQRKRYRVNVPAGVKDGTRIRLAGKGEDGPLGGPPGDLYVTTRVAPSPIFGRRAHGNLEVDVPITLAEAIGGANIEVPTLRGTKRIRVAPGTEHGSIQRLRGEGPPKPNTRDRGDIHYRLEIQIPKDLDRKQREAVDELSRSLDGADAARADPPRCPARERGILRARRGSSGNPGKVGTA